MRWLGPILSSVLLGYLAFAFWRPLHYWVLQDYFDGFYFATSPPDRWKLQALFIVGLSSMPILSLLVIRLGRVEDFKCYILSFFGLLLTGFLFVIGRLLYLKRSLPKEAEVLRTQSKTLVTNISDLHLELFLMGGLVIGSVLLIVYWRRPPKRVGH